jgi:hypothetical protein
MSGVGVGVGGWLICTNVTTEIIKTNKPTPASPSPIAACGVARPGATPVV